MSNPVCTTASLNPSCFQDPTINAIQRKAFKIWYLENELAYLGGTNYLANPQLLINAANSVFEKMSMNQVDAAEVQVFFKNAQAAGSPATAVPNQQIGFIQKFVQLDTNDLEKIIVFLECSLGVHKTFPQ